MAFLLLDNPRMDIVARVSSTLSDWMRGNPDLDTIEKLSIRSKVGFGTIRRAKNGDGNITIKNLELIAKAFRRPVEDLIGINYPVSENVQPLQAKEPDWLPQSIQEIVDAAKKLDATGQAKVAGYAAGLIEKYPAKTNPARSFNSPH